MAANNEKRPITLAPPASAPGPAPGRHPSRTNVIARASAVLALIASATFAVSFVTAQENTPSAASTPQATPEATPSAKMPRLELQLEELNDSGIDGTVTLYEFGDRTIVEFDVEGSGGGHPANISVGVCGDLEPEPAHELQPLDKEGQSLTVVDVSLDDLLESEHAIDVRLAPDQLGTLIACANIEGEPEVPTAGTPAASPTGEGGQVTTAAVTETPAATSTSTATVAATVTPVSTPTEAAEATATDGTGGAISGNEPTATIQLAEQNASGVTGTAVLTQQGNATKISLLLTGDAVTGDHIAHLHAGTCAAPGEYTYTLNPVTAEGISETVVNLSLDELLTGGYFINVHPSEAGWDTWMVCGELVSTGGTVATVTPTPNVPTTTTAGGQVTTQPTTIPVQTITAATTPATVAPVTGDGTSGVTGGTTVPSSVQTLPQQAGVGAMLDWPTDPRAAILWASIGGAVILGAAALAIRRGERHQTTTHSRWTRLGI
jgi:hypothetical protein